jgi:hypothetical protein
MLSFADVFGLHPLLVCEAIQTHYRPKLERYVDTDHGGLVSAYRSSTGGGAIRWS